MRIRHNIFLLVLCEGIDESFIRRSMNQIDIALSQLEN